MSTGVRFFDACQSSISIPRIKLNLLSWMISTSEMLVKIVLPWWMVFFLHNSHLLVISDVKWLIMQSIKLRVLLDWRAKANIWWIDEGPENRWWHSLHLNVSDIVVEYFNLSELLKYVYCSSKCWKNLDRNSPTSCCMSGRKSGCNSENAFSNWLKKLLIFYIIPIKIIVIQILTRRRSKLWLSAFHCSNHPSIL